MPEYSWNNWVDPILFPYVLPITQIALTGGTTGLHPGNTKLHLARCKVSPAFTKVSPKLSPSHNSDTSFKTWYWICCLMLKVLEKDCIHLPDVCSLFLSWFFWCKILQRKVKKVTYLNKYWFLTQVYLLKFTLIVYITLMYRKHFLNESKSPIMQHNLFTQLII